MRQQNLGERDTIPCLRDPVVPEPPRQAFAPALGLSTIGHVRSHGGELRALAPDDAADQRGEGQQVPGEHPRWLARISL